MHELDLLEPPYRLALAIFRDSIRAFADGDYELARTLKLKDRKLDALTDDVIERLVERAGHESESVPSYLDLIFVARAFERVGDNSTNIAEDSLRQSVASTDETMNQSRNHKYPSPIDFCQPGLGLKRTR